MEQEPAPVLRAWSQVQDWAKKALDSDFAAFRQSPHANHWTALATSMLVYQQVDCGFSFPPKSKAKMLYELEQAPLAKWPELIVSTATGQTIERLLP